MSKRTVWFACAGFSLSVVALCALVLALYFAFWLRMPLLGALAVLAAFGMALAIRFTVATLLPRASNPDLSYGLPYRLDQQLRSVRAHGRLAAQVQRFLFGYYEQRKGFLPHGVDEMYMEPYQLLQKALSKAYLTADELARLDAQLPAYEAFLARAAMSPDAERNVVRWASYDIFLYQALAREYLLSLHVGQGGQK